VLALDVNLSLDTHQQGPWGIDIPAGVVFSFYFLLERIFMQNPEIISLG